MRWQTRLVQATRASLNARSLTHGKAQAELVCCKVLHKAAWNGSISSAFKKEWVFKVRFLKFWPHFLFSTSYLQWPLLGCMRTMWLPVSWPSTPSSLTGTCKMLFIGRVSCGCKPTPICMLIKHTHTSFVLPVLHGWTRKPLLLPSPRPNLHTPFVLPPFCFYVHTGPLEAFGSASLARGASSRLTWPSA